MWNFNLVVTLAPAGGYARLLAELGRYGEFHRTEFLGVILGRVEDIPAFFTEAEQRRREPGSPLADIGRVVPLVHTFIFTAATLEERLRQEALGWLDALAGASFYVRLERRGMKGQLLSPEVERGLDAFLLQRLEERGQPGRIDYDDPDRILAVETVGERCGIGLLDRALRQRFDFVRVP